MVYKAKKFRVRGGILNRAQKTARWKRTPIFILSLAGRGEEGIAES
jgi:hypothetical protein